MTTRRIFIDVDTQVDFMSPDGALYVPGAEDLNDNLARLTAFARERRVPIVATADAHTPDDPEFAEFPPHCVRGTPGAARVAATALPGAPEIAVDMAPDEALRTFREAGAVVVTAQAIDKFTNPNLGVLVEAEDPDTEFVVYGVATEYCVKGVADGLLARGRRVTLVTDAMAGLTAEAHTSALAALEAAGARPATTEQVVEEAAR